MAAYKKIIGTSIRPSGEKPKGAMFSDGVGSHPKSGVSIRTTQPKTGVGRNSWMGSQAHGPNTVHEARGKHLA